MATRKEMQNALQQPYDRIIFAKQVMHPVFGPLFNLFETGQKPRVDPTNSEKAVINEVSIYGSVVLEDGTDITCYEVVLQPTVRIDQSKIAIQQYVRKLLISGQAALINFISPANKDIWRFTLVAKDSKITDDGIAEVQTHPQRYTYLVERDRPNRTMAERLETLSLESAITLEKLIQAFSVEAMSKAFFIEYKEHYQNFVEYLTGKRMVKQGDKWIEQVTGKPSPFLASLFYGNEKDARNFIKKLMGRIVFLYFVQKKRWLGASTTEYNDGPYDFIFTLFDQTGGDKNFFPVGLSELFFNALNKERKDDDWTMPSGKIIKIPYLNGGLFVRDEIDEKIHKKGDTLNV
jgi:adenine-specific DNA-methyltransferase